MKYPKLMAAGVALAGVLAVPGFAVAQNAVYGAGEGPHGPMLVKHHFHPGPHHGGHCFEHITEELELTEGQKAQLKANREAGREERRAQRKQMHELHKQLREAIASGADQATLDSLGAKLGKLKVAEMQRRHEKRKAFEAILTDDQKARMQALKAERKERREAHRKEHGKEHRMHRKDED